MGSAAPLEGVAATALAVAAIRAEETARPDRLFADPLAEAFVAASGWSPSRPSGDRRAVVLRAWVVARTVFPRTLPHFPMVLHRGGFPDGS